MRFTAIFLIFIFSSSLVYADSWYDKFDFKSDVRLRHEGINKENSSYKDRMRIRARAGFNVEVQENVDFIFQLATGGKNPVSTNQTLDGSFSTKDIGIDLAYIDWKINNNVNVNRKSGSRCIVCGKLRGDFNHQDAAAGKKKLAIK